MKIQHIKFLLILIVVTVVGVSIREDRASALVNLQPDPNAWVQTVPGPIYTEMRRADSALQSPSLFTWLSDDSNTAAQTVSVNYGAPNVALKLNFAGVVGWAPNQVIANRAKIISASGNGPSGNSLGAGTVSNLTSSPLQINFTPGENTPGKYTYSGDVFNFKPGGTQGFIREGEYSVYVITKSINQFRNSAGQLSYRCVPSGRGVPSWDSWDLCETTGWTLKINIDITPTPPYNNKPVLNLCATGSPSDSTVQPGGSYKLCPRVDNIGTGATLGIFSLGVQNRYLATPSSSYAVDVGQADLSPAANRAQIFGVYKDYLTDDTNCSPNQGASRDCWLWLFQDLLPNKNVYSNFTFKVKNSAPVGGQVCFLPFVRRSTPTVNSQTGDILCFTIQTPPNCPAGTDYAGQPLASQPDRNGDGVVDAADCNNPPPPTNYPYLLIKGSNVISGANFTDNGPCTTNTEATGADIYTNGFHGDDVADGLNGSSNAQYGVWSSGDIGQNGSSNNTFRANYGYRRNAVGTTDDIRDVLFANTNWSIPNTENGNFYDGDSTNPSLPCVDISADLLGAGIPVPAIPIPGGGNAQSFLNTPSPGKLYINGDEDIRNVNIKPGVNKTLIVKGTLTIGNDVTYPSSYSATDIPNVKIIASNIYIEDGTQRIDANLIAFPTLNGTTFENGIIDTCSNMTWQLSGGGTSVVPGGWPNDGRMTTDSCKQSPSLVINGSIAARRILWKRTNGTLGTQAAAADSSCYFANYSDASDDPKIVDKATMVRRYEKCAAETINTSPELYISELNNNPTQTLQVVPISTQELPPIF